MDDFKSQHRTSPTVVVGMCSSVTCIICSILPLKQNLRSNIDHEAHQPVRVHPHGFSVMTFFMGSNTKSFAPSKHIGS